MDEDTGKRILGTIRDNGWELYCFSVPSRSHDANVLLGRGRANSLEQGSCYDILPRLTDPPDKAKLDDFVESNQVMPRLVVPPYSLPSFVLGIAQFSGGDSDDFYFPPGNEVFFTGFELLEDRVRLFTAHATEFFMSYDVFLGALETLQDISALVAPAGP